MYLHLPTWFITNRMTDSLPMDHPWYQKRFALKDWADGATWLTTGFDLFAWGQIILWIIFAIRIFGI